tara:strand:+ start:16589 stop:17134 length:546 start_codon:yes stop_codon:yes gene_type:complete
MIAISNIQEKIGRFWLNKETKRLKRKVKAFSIEKASTIGVIYNATNRDDSEIVKKFIQYLKEERKDVISLGFIESKDSSDIVKPHLNYTFFDKRNISKAFIPKGNDVESFIKKPFSILIDLNTEACFPIEYISALSSAKFKVGVKGFYHNNVCDLVIDIEENRKLKFLIIQIKHYLKMIKN